MVFCSQNLVFPQTSSKSSAESHLLRLGGTFPDPLQLCHLRHKGGWRRKIIGKIDHFMMRKFAATKNMGKTWKKTWKDFTLQTLQDLPQSASSFQGAPPEHWVVQNPLPASESWGPSQPGMSISGLCIWLHHASPKIVGDQLGNLPTSKYLQILPRPRWCPPSQCRFHVLLLQLAIDLNLK